ncbi:MAG: peptidylprolyl isomerase [Marinilabiliaceae bacterium]
MNKGFRKFLTIQTFTAVATGLIMLTGCAGGSGQQEESGKTYQDNVKSMVEIQTLDRQGYDAEKGYGFYVAPDLIVTNFQWLKGAYRANMTTVSSDKTRKVKGYKAVDLDRGLVLLEVSGDHSDFIDVEEREESPDSLYSLNVRSGKLYVRKSQADQKQDSDSVNVWSVSSELEAGKPAFTLDHGFTGIVRENHSGEKQNAVLPGKWIAELLDNQLEESESIYDLRLKSDKEYISHEKVKAFRVETTMGNITIRLYDETPKFRDNFIKLVSDDFYDSLLVHRVVEDFLIQTGAADSRDAEKGEELGYEGPGYNLPTNTQPSLFHKRGAVSVPKLPEEDNPGNRSNGSQFFIVSGHQFNDKQLDEIEEENDITFSEEQRETYKTQGGAPGLDGNYTVFGEVVSGMDVVDKIASVETDRNERPVNDVMIKDIEIIEK